MTGRGITGLTVRDASADAARSAVLIEAEELMVLRAGAATPPVVLDVRWTLGRTDGREQYLAGHVPGSVYVDLETERRQRKP